MSGLAELWESTAGTTPVPNLPDNQVEAFMVLAGSLDEAGADVTFSRWDPLSEEDPFPAMALAGDPSRAALVAALQVTELLALTSPKLADMTIYIDPCPDYQGNHRMYIRDEEEMPGLPWAAFESVDDGAKWMAAQLRGEQSPPPELEDDWELSAWAGSYVLEMLLAEDIPELWQRAKEKTELGEPLTPSFDLDMPETTPHWRRAAALWLLTQLRGGDFDEDIATKLAGMSDSHAAFVAHIRDLAQAGEGITPGFIAGLAQGDGDLSKGAKEWLGIDTGRDDETSQLAPLVTGALRASIEEMIAAELVEIPEESREIVVARLVAAAENAANGKQLIRAVVGILLDAPEVEEVYGTDTELRSIFVKHFSE